MSLIIDRFALPYSEIGSFNDLPIPFACVATNLVTGKAEVFRSGSLSSALRATMSIPGVFTPVTGKDGTFADGGLLNNIPIDIAKKMGADIVLGVHLETAPLSPNAKLNTFAVLGRSVDVMISANELRSMEDADLMITVPALEVQLHGLQARKRNHPGRIRGRCGKRESSRVLLRRPGHLGSVPRSAGSPAQILPVPEFVAVSGANGNLSQQVADPHVFHRGKPIDFEELNQRILELNGLGRFSSINYSLTEKNGQQGLTMDTNEKSYAPPLVQPLILIDGSNFENAQFNLGARITFLDVGGFRSEWRNDFILFSEYGLRSEYYHPFTPKSRWFIAPRGSIDDVPLYIYEENTQIATYRAKSGAGGVDLGRIYGRSGEFRMGYEGGWQKYSRQSGDPTLPTFSGAFGDIRFQYKLDLLDEAVLPRQGHYVLGGFRWTNTSPIATNQYPVLEGSSINYFKVSEPSSIFINGFGGTTFNYATGLPQFSLGGSVRLVAYGQNELLVEQILPGPGRLPAPICQAAPTYRQWHLRPWPARGRCRSTALRSLASAISPTRQATSQPRSSSNPSLAPSKSAMPTAKAATTNSSFASAASSESTGVLLKPARPSRISNEGDEAL